MTGGYCRDCGEDLDDGRKRRCPPCQKVHRHKQKMAWFAANPEKVAASKLKRATAEKEARRQEREELEAHRKQATKRAGLRR